MFSILIHPSYSKTLGRVVRAEIVEESDVHPYELNHFTSKASGRLRKNSHPTMNSCVLSQFATFSSSSTDLVYLPSNPNYTENLELWSLPAQDNAS